ncbi:NAD dependent epimerase/dehydratase [Seiridium cupressi]
MRLLRSFSTRRTTSRTSWSPAIHGSVAILEALQKWGTSIKRIVATSSHASCVDISKGKRPGYVYDEKDWNPVTYEEASKADGVSAYCASKALAERAMWGWVETNKPNFDLVTFTPPWAHWSPDLDFRPRRRARDVANAGRSAEGRAPRSGLASTSPE